MAKDLSLVAAYKFFLDHAKTQGAFTAEDLGAATSWSGSTPNTYLSKQVKSVVKRIAPGKFQVKKSFVNMAQDTFLQRVSQKENILPSYKRACYDSVLTYEFLMPLTREELLKESLDRLLYKDALEEQIELVGYCVFATVMPKDSCESEKTYCSRVAKRIGDYFGGYSITHVSGRFRIQDLLPKQQAIHTRYVIDETTALVRFIVPLLTSETKHGEIFSENNPAHIDPNKLDDEVRLVRRLFFHIFAEVVVHSVQGEDEIWLLETLNGQHKLYKWEVER